MREYSRRQLDDFHALEERRTRIYQEIPEIKQLDEMAGRVSLSAAREVLFRPDDAENGGVQEAADPSSEKSLSLRDALKQISRKRALLLKEHGYPADSLELHYFCPDCKDTGYIGSERCHCFRQAAIDLLYRSSGMTDRIRRECFENFELSCYPADKMVPYTGVPIREHMKQVLEECRSYADDFDRKGGNLLFYGNTGLGKTFLSHCIASRLLENAHSVVYLSAADLFKVLADQAFGKRQASSSLPEEDTGYLSACDLLIIDDLGTEITNSFVVSALFTLLNERMETGKSIIISTNLQLQALADLYSERIFSRISSGFRLLAFYGDDIRIRKMIRQVKKIQD